MTVVRDTILTPCATSPEDYQDEQLQTAPAPGTVSPLEWQSWTARRAAAHRRCAGCPVMVDCLYRAVVEVDVSGFVACTTEDDRREIRRRLGIDVDQQSLMPYGAPRLGTGPISHEAVLAARDSHPKDTSQQLAERLGCSTSTVKRHLRRAREQKLVEQRPDRVAPPSVEAVLDCFDDLETSRVA